VTTSPGTEHPLAVAAPPRVAAWLAQAPDGPVAVLHACADVVHLDVAGRCVSILAAGVPGLPTGLQTNLFVVSSETLRSPYVGRGTLRWDGRVLVTGRLVDVRAPRIDPGVPQASPAAVQGTPRSRVAGLVAFPDRVTPATVPFFVGRGEGLTPLGDDVRVGWLALHRAVGVSTPDVDDAVRRSLGGTTTLSATLLDCALAGEVADPLCDHLAALGGDRQATTRARLETWGASSGLGLAHGVDLACAALAGREEAA
jgi:hypothetical protein